MEHESYRGDDERITGEQLIYRHITQALQEQRPIDHATARAIASHFHDRPGSALHAFGVTGCVVDGLGVELDRWRQADTSVEREPWLDALEEYLGSRDDPGPVKAWRDVCPRKPTYEDGERATGEDERPPFENTPNLGQLAASAVVDQPRNKNIPKLETDAKCDGQGWLQRLPAGWQAVLGWGVHGWDLAEWPFNIIVVYDNPAANIYALGIYDLGNITVMQLPSHKSLHEAIDDIAEWNWRNGAALGPEDLPKTKGLLPEHRGPFSWARLQRWKRQLERHGNGTL